MMNEKRLEEIIETRKVMKSQTNNPVSEAYIDLFLQDLTTLREDKDNVVEWDDWIKSYFKPPFRYDSYWTYIRDSENKMVADIRWRWAIQKLNNPEEKQDAVWELIAKLLNDYFSKDLLPDAVKSKEEKVEINELQKKDLDCYQLNKVKFKRTKINNL